jgi:hypothetical protein
MSGFPWFRIYNEITTDRKITRAADIAGVSKMTALGVWVTMLALASESPRRGVLLVSEGVPVTPGEIIRDCELESPAIIAALESLKMIRVAGGVMEIVKWGQRQPNSDSSAARTRQYRERKKGDGFETSPTRHRDVLESESESDSNIATTARASPDLAAIKGRLATYYQTLTGRDPPGVTAAQMWEDDCLTILDYAGDDEALAQQLIDEAVKILDGLSYGHKEPGSLLVTIEQQLKKRNRQKRGASKKNETRQIETSGTGSIHPEPRTVGAAFAGRRRGGAGQTLPPLPPPDCAGGSPSPVSGPDELGHS